MPPNYALFEATDLHRAVRYRMARLQGMLWAIVVAAAGFILLSRTLVVVSPAAIGSGAVLVLAILACLGIRRCQLSRTVWCVKVLPDSIVAYDCSCRKTTLAWQNIQRVNVTDDALWIGLSPTRSIALSTSFNDFTDLSHHITRHAEAHGIPVCLDGRPVEDLDVYALCPFLSDDSSADAAAPHH